MIRDDTLYHGVRVVLDARIATAHVKLRIDVNFGDPVTPGPKTIELPALRPDQEPVRLLGYPIETVLAEKIATAILLGEANTRVRDFADVYTLTGAHRVTLPGMREALKRTAAFRELDLVTLSEAIGNLADLRGQAYTAYREGLGQFGNHLPEDFAAVLAAACRFADPLVAESDANRRWEPNGRQWIGR